MANNEASKINKRILCECREADDPDFFLLRTVNYSLAAYEEETRLWGLSERYSLFFHHNRYCSKQTNYPI